DPVSDPGVDVVGDVHHVRDDGAGGRLGAGAPAVEQDVADEVPLHVDGVEDAVHLSEQDVLGDEGGVDAHLHLRATGLSGGGGGGVTPGDGQQLDHVPQLAGVAEVRGAEAGDPLPVDGVRGDLGAEGERGEDGQLVAGVDPLDVVRRVALGVPQGLGLRQCGG